nr:PREDICTED: uncharacterized protein LOC105664135 [Megachile rotundata]
MKCQFFDELNEIFGHRPIINQTGVDSTLLPLDLSNKTSGEASLSSDTQHPLPSSSPILNSLLDDSRSICTRPLRSQEVDNCNELRTSKKRKICGIPTSLSRENPRAGFKNIMQNCVNQIMESQEKLLMKSIEE